MVLYIKEGNNLMKETLFPTSIMVFNHLAKKIKNLAPFLVG